MISEYLYSYHEYVMSQIILYGDESITNDNPKLVLLK